MTPDTQQDISAMWDSVSVIDEIIKADKHDEMLDDDVRRNYQHLEIMINRPNIIDSGEDLTPFVECIAQAKTWLGE
jgi:hypothetical protein